MTTRPIREALAKMQKARVDHEAHSAALEAVRAIEEMARVMVRKDVTSAKDEAHDLLESIAKEAP